jgi:hypothetical protein
MGAFDNLLQCTVGGTSFQLDNYSLTIAPIVVANIGRTGSQISVKGKGWIEAASADELASTTTTQADTFQISGAAFSVSGVGGATEYSLSPAQCLDGGPHFTLTIEEQTEALIKRINFEVSARTVLPTTGYTLNVTTRPDGLMSVQQDGQISGDGSTVAAALSAFKAVYPPANWIISYKTTTDSLGLHINYSFTAVQLLVPYPSIDQSNAIVDGEAQVRRDRDEQYRISTTYDYDLLITGDYLQVVDDLRSLAMQDEENYSSSDDGADDSQEAVVLKESVSVTIYKEARVRATFNFLRGGDGNKLLNWTQTIDFVDDQDIYQIQQYNGADAVLIQQPSTMQRILQSGQATGLGAFPMAPDPIIEDAYIEEPRITLVAVNSIECQTSWNFLMASDDDFDLSDYTDQLVRPSDPSFYGATD